MNRIRLWPYAALIVLGCAIVAGVAGLLWTRYERTAQAKEMPGAARIERVNGEVGLNQSLDESAKTQWIQATANTPISVGDRVITKDNSQAELAFTGRNFATIEANSSMDVLELSDQKTQLALRDGSALFDVGALSSGTLYEVATPCGAVDVEEPGTYRVDASESEKATATALSGRASVIGQGGTGTLGKGETLTIPCQGAPGAVRTQVDYGQAGAMLDSYYRSRYPRTYDGRYRNYYTYLDDPYYFDPYRREISYKYVSDYIPGVEDLDDYGSWTYVNDYGYCWHPSVAADWAPYQSGSWAMDYPYGLTWVSNEPWGYAPYHYGRWTFASNEWFWVPEGGRSYPTYSPALVAFIPFGGSSVGWVALGPSDPYAPRYYDANWQAVYLSRRQEFGDRVANFAVPGAVTIVPAQQFTRVIDPRVITRVDAQTIARVRPVMDPLAVDPLRQAAFRTRDGRARFDVPQTIAQRINTTSVVTSTGPRAPLFRHDLDRAMRIEQVSDRARNQKLQIAEQRAPAGAAPVANGGASPASNLAAEQTRERQMLELAKQAGRGDRVARQQMLELRRQQVEQQRLDRANAQQMQGERAAQQQNPRALLHQQQQVQREAARQQMITSQQQRRAAAAQQLQVQREQRQQTEVLRAQQRSVRHADQPRLLKVQPAPQIRERKPPTHYQVPVQPRVMTPQPQVMRSQPNRQNEPLAAPQAMRQQRQVPPQPRPQPQGAPKQQSAPAAPKEQKKKPPQ
jgi:FecR protein